MIRPILTQNLPVNPKKITKLAQSKQALEAAKHCEYIIRQYDGYHATIKDTKLLRQEAIDTIDNIINRLFIGLSQDEKLALSNQIFSNVMTKWNNMVDKVKNVQFYNVGKAGTTILNSAKRRDVLIDKADGILNEMKENGQSAPTRPQRRMLRKTLKRAMHCENRRLQYVTARQEALVENENIAKSSGIDVYRAYEYLYKVPDAPAPSKIKPMIVK